MAGSFCFRRSGVLSSILSLVAAACSGGPSTPSAGGAGNSQGSTNQGAGGNTDTGGGSTSSGGLGGSSSGSNSSGSSSSGSNSSRSSSSGTVTCDSGTTTTTWASSCPTSAPACTAGTWTTGGPDPDHAAFKLIKESTHFAIYSDEAVSDATATAALDTLETTVWTTFFGSPIYMKEPLCNSSTKTKASIHVHSDWGLTGGSWATGRMGMWIGTGALNDHWGLAHEFTHAVQSVEGGMVCDQSNTCGWIYESHANWHAHQLLEYHTTNVHCSEMSVNAPHLYLGSTRDRYCNWQFMEYLKDKYCYSAVEAIWTGTPSNDPFTSIMNARGWNIGQLNDFFGEWAMHNVTWDYQDPKPQSTAGGNQGAFYRSQYGTTVDASQTQRLLRLTKLDPLDTSYATNRRFVSPTYQAPQRWGYNVVRLYPEAGAKTVTATFRGVVQSAANSDFRWGLVATDSAIATPRYSALQKGTDGSLTFCINAGEALFLVVVATPSVQKQIVWDQMYNTVYRYPYMISLQNAWPEGWQNGTQAACPSGLARHANGGGCAPSSLAASVYVGPYATVRAGTNVSGNARIDDHATVVSGSVTGGTVAGLTLLGSTTQPYNANAFTVSGSAVVKTTFYPLGFYESGQGVSGTASLIGDVEYRGVGTNVSSGTQYGFVDTTTTPPANTTDVTLAPPHAWRP